MGKSGGKKKKGNQGSSSDVHNVNNASNGSIDLDSAVFLKRAHELKEEGNKRFQVKDYVGALEQYDNAIKLIPKMHPDRAVFHSNRAACLMQMRPIDYDSVILECTMALQVQPRFVRALLRRARAYEAIGRYDMAMEDVKVLLGSEPNHRDALDISRRLQVALGPRQESQQDLQSRPSPAALGASAVRGAPIAGLGPCLPARPPPKKGGGAVGGNNGASSVKNEKSLPVVAAENGPNAKPQMPKVVLKPVSGSSMPNEKAVKGNLKEQAPASSLSGQKQYQVAPIRWRQLKLVYDHDIRLAQIPVNCSFRVLREIVGKRFPSSKSVLIKYKDSDGDLVTITCTGELKLAEAFVDDLVPKVSESDKLDSFGMLRLHIVEVNPEQEPPIPEEEEEVEEKPVESEEIKGDEGGSHSSVTDVGVDSTEIEADKTVDKASVENGKIVASEEAECKEVEMDDWLFEFAQLFRNNVGIDPDAHVDLHEIGMELCSEALEETVTSDEAQMLFDKAAVKFQEVAALAFFNWGNVHMCAARKKIAVDENASEEVKAAQLQKAYHWVKEKYSLAKDKYEEALSIKPDFYEGLLAMGQQQFEMAKLHWSYALAKKEDLSCWDSSETFTLFDNAEVKMKAATEMWEKLEEQRAKELKDPNSIKVEDVLKRRKKAGNDGESSSKIPAEPTPDELAEQKAVMRSQIHLFWGNMLFERSQIEFRLGVADWKNKLDSAVERFKLAGASEADISTVTSNHCSNSGDPAGGESKKADNVSVQTVATRLK